MNTIKLPIKLKGKYKIEVIGADGNVRHDTGWFDNLITNNGLDILGGTGNIFTYCSVGSGNATPAVTDTSLQTFVAATSTQLSQARSASGSPPWYGAQTITYQFGIGVATGNLSEVGIGGSAGGINLFSRALILDGIGNPTTITVLSGEALNVTYQLQNFSPATDVTGTVNISGTNYNYTVRAANASNASDWGPFYTGETEGINTTSFFAYDGTIGPVTGSVTGTGAGRSTSVTNAAYVTSNYYIDSTVSYGLADGNIGPGLNAFTYSVGTSFGSLGAFQVQLSAHIPKDNTTVLTLGFRTSWSA